MQRELVKPLYARPGALGTSNGVYTNMTRRIPTAAERILDAPGMINDYYLNLIAWSCTNLVGVALRESVYIWNAETNETEILSTCENENGYVSSVDFSSDGSYSGIGLDSGEVEIWDVETKQKLRTMSGHQGQVSVLSWNHHIISSGCADGSIWHHDVRIANHKVMELLGHTGEVCGLKWRQDGEALASGANDNVVNCWDPRVGTAGSNSRGQPKWSKSVHTAAVKAIAWAPWNMNILASGGGTSDCKINVWSASTGSRLHSLTTPAQVTSVHFSPHSKEIFSTHGFPTNAIMLHSYPALEKITEIRDAHDARILNSAVSPNGDFIVTNSGDENIKFWRIWELPVKKHKKKQNVQLENGLQSIR
ncbi:WD40-repeat-containing domain protein [Cantharellus anzutake]|uniref:WD40-repeat-containing domain protein n=1 Tax=Cantharellus anzutake TaxID=1750568 RepID=UPI001905D789|nr:WD40-repeat-containing domain protein [Cantharellus anzutake]KAF8318813.1 WD40-repeat-containing domain protein [Cantharellus anzutake]